jgi:hypothetical protein
MRTEDTGTSHISTSRTPTAACKGMNSQTFRTHDRRALKLTAILRMRGQCHIGIPPTRAQDPRVPSPFTQHPSPSPS